MRLHEGSTTKIFSILLRWEPFRKALESTYHLHKGLEKLYPNNEINNGEFTEEYNFWDDVEEFIAENIKNKEGKKHV